MEFPEKSQKESLTEFLEDIMEDFIKGSLEEFQKKIHGEFPK